MSSTNQGWHLKHLNRGHWKHNAVIGNYAQCRYQNRCSYFIQLFSSCLPWVYLENYMLWITSVCPLKCPVLNSEAYIAFNAFRSRSTGMSLRHRVELPWQDWCLHQKIQEQLVCSPLLSHKLGWNNTAPDVCTAGSRTCTYWMCSHFSLGLPKHQNCG